MSLAEAGAKALYARLPHGPHSGHDQEWVRCHQRTRLLGAMVEAVSRCGYDRVTVTQVVALAWVSRCTFYEQFSGKEECFLATFDSIVSDTEAHVAASVAGLPIDSSQRLHAALSALLEYMDEHPREARLCLIDPAAPTPAVRTRLCEVLHRAERSLTGALCAGGDETPSERLMFPPIVCKVIVQGLRHLICAQLRRDQQTQLAGLVPELCEWVLSYRCPPGALTDPPPAVSARVVVPRQGSPGGDERTRLQRAALEIAGRSGWFSLTRDALLSLADVSDHAFDTLYQDIEQCLLDSLDLLAAELLVRMRASQSSALADRPPSWPATVRRSVIALLELFTREPVLARVAFVEAPCGGSTALVHLERRLDGFAELLHRSVPRHSRPSHAVSQAIVGAVWGILHDYIAVSAFAQLSELTGQLSFVLLAPTTRKPAVSTDPRLLSGHATRTRSPSITKPPLEPA